MHICNPSGWDETKGSRVWGQPGLNRASSKQVRLYTETLTEKFRMEVYARMCSRSCSLALFLSLSQWILLNLFFSSTYLHIGYWNEVSVNNIKYTKVEYLLPELLGIRSIPGFGICLFVSTKVELYKMNLFLENTLGHSHR